MSGQQDTGRAGWPSGDDHQVVIDQIKAWVLAHPGCTPDEVVAGLRLPSMAGIPADRQARSSAQQTAATRARDARQHVEYVIRTYRQPAPEAAS